MHKTTLPKLACIPKPATIGISPSDFTISMRKSVAHSRIIKMKREREMKCKHAKGLILAQLYPKYSKDPTIRMIINKEVNDFMKHVRFPIQQNDLATLEEDIQAQFRPDTLFAYRTGRLTMDSPRRMRMTGQWESTSPMKPKSSGHANPVEEEEEEDDTLVNYAEDSKKTTGRVGTGEMDWTALQTYYNLKEEEDDERRALENETKIQETNRVRRLQLEEMKRKQDEANKNKEMTRKAIMTDYERFKEEELEKQRQAKITAAHIRQIQETQLQEREESRKFEQERTEKTEKKEVKRIKQLLEYEEQQAYEEKMKKRSELQKVQTDNMAHKSILAKEEAEEKKRDIILMKEERDKLERQELERELWLRRTYDRQQKLAEMNKLNRKEEFMSEEALEERIKKHFEERESELDRIEGEKQDEIYRQNHSQQDALREQMAQRKREDELRSQQDRDYRKKLVIENKKAEEREREAEKERKRAAEKVRDIQFQQVKENKAKNEYHLSKRERDLNKKALETIQQDDELRHTIEGRMGMYAPQVSPVRHEKQTTSIF